MKIDECERLAQDLGFDSTSFDLTINLKTHKANWLDAYMGAFTVEGFNGVFYTSQIRHIDHNCENLK